MKIDEKTLMTMVNAFYARIANSGNELEAMEFALSFAHESGYLTGEVEVLREHVAKLHAELSAAIRERDEALTRLSERAIERDKLRAELQATQSELAECRMLKAAWEANAKRTDGAVVTPGQELVTRAEFNALIQVLRDHNINFDPAKK